MKLLRLAACLLPAAVLVACASNNALYPQPYIGKGTPITPSPEDVAAFKARTLHSPPHSDVQGLAEAYISQHVPHPSSVTFRNEFESIGKSLAVCGQVRYRNKFDQMTEWRPFFVEFTRKPTKGTKAPYDYNPEDELAKLCGPLATNPPSE